jgi:hypothetical protein
VDINSDRAYDIQVGDKRELICYCFGYTAADIALDYAAGGGTSSILAKITEARQNNTCRCDEKHPEHR